VRTVDEGGAGTSGRRPADGASGVVLRAGIAGVTGVDAAEGALVPAMFVAVTVKV
jgi:hypothetical protein